MGDKLFIAIGVSKATGLPDLPGVWRSIDDMVAWASKAGYDIVKITDENARVDVLRVKTEIEQGISSGLSRIILYFVGHGFSVPPEQYLILSAGPNVPDQRIARDGLRDMLATRGPTQISVITDACMVMAPFRGLAVSVLDPEDGEVPSQTFDGFYATQPNTQAFAFRATTTDPGLCLFSWVLHRALTFQDEAARDAYESIHGRSVVTSYSLGDYLDKTLPIEAAARQVWQQPQTNTGFRPPNHVYSEVIETLLADDGGDGPDLTLETLKRGVPASSTPPRPPRPPRKPSQPLEERIRSEWRRPFMQWAFDKASKTHANLILDVLGGAKPVVRTSREPNVRLEPLAPFRGQDHRSAFAVTTGDLNEDHARSETILLRMGGLYSLIPMYRSLWAVVQAEKGRGPIAVAWGNDIPSSGNEISSLEVLKGLVTGRLSASDIPALAASMRNDKHSDPMKGIVSAYLYDSIGDVENIRRMCWFYQFYEQDIPFDIALLSRLPLEIRDGRLWVDIPEVAEGRDQEGPPFTYQATLACRAIVAGHAPLLRAGWSKIQPEGPWKASLARLAEDLTDNPIATFKGKAARDALIELISTR